MDGILSQTCHVIIKRYLELYINIKVYHVDLYNIFFFKSVITIINCKDFFFMLDRA